MIVCLLFSILSAQNLEKAKIEITILHTNDHHGSLMPFDLLDQKQVGGMAARMTLIKEIQKEAAQKKGHVLILDCGDINTGNPTSDMLQAEPDVLLMNKMGYHAMAVGNHEFDLKLEALLSQQKKAHFPYLSANAVYQKTGQPIFQQKLVLSLGDMKVGIFGITPYETPYISTCGRDPEIVFLKPEEVIPGVLESLEKECDFIIAMLHIEHTQAVTIAQRFPKINLVIGGHTHLPIIHPLQIGKTLLAEAGSYGIMVGRFDLSFEDRQLQDWKYKMIGINLSKPILAPSGKIGCLPFERSLEPDPEVIEFLKPYLGETEDRLSRSIGIALDNIARNSATLELYSSSLGNLICDAIRQETNVDIALQNVGGIRSDIPKGTITPRHILQVLPFANSIFLYNIKGKELRKIFECMCSGKIGPKGMLEASGMEVQIQGNQLTSIAIEGKPLIEEKIYRVAINSFIAKGGDGYDIFSQFPSVDTGLLISNIVQKYIENQSSLSPKHEKRVVWQTPETPGNKEVEKKQGIK
ncbi:MAG: 5'-nucleotidase C-terminal domain-containing protein [Candidatus Brocadiae bacterium]|nr:5'-nucleotidase C-terminal domain-containing protein [Candidatus Brocadiia bacterium]